MLLTKLSSPKVLGAVLAMALAVLGLGFAQGVRKAAPAAAQTAPEAPVPMALEGFVAQITLGLKDTEPKDWDGEIQVRGGRVIQISPRQTLNARISGSRWSASSRIQGQAMNQQMRPAVLLVHLDAPAAANVEVRTKRGNFAFGAADLKLGSPATFLEGAVSVERVPITQQLTRQPTEDDFPACTTAADGTVWCAYVAYQTGNLIATEDVNKGKFDSLITKGNGDQVRLMKFDGKQWTGSMEVSEAKLDAWRPAVAVDGQGMVWVVWSQNAGGDWDIFARSYDPKANRWSDVQRITTEAGADVGVVAATGKSGRVWLAWQRWESGDFAIRAQSLGGPRSTRRTRNFGGANEWNPSIAADSKGKIYIAFDTYSAGNYDTYLWVLDENAPQPTGETIPIAASPRFEARPSIVVDSQDRVWIAYEDAAPNWAKDFGTRWEGKQGVPFYLDRNIIVRCYAGGRVQQTQRDVKSIPVETIYPPSERQRLSMPRLNVDGDGRLWLLFRRHPLRNGAGERWVSFATYYQGGAWSPPVELPFSDNLLDNRPALAPLKAPGKSAALAVYSTDGRTAGTNTAVENNLYAAFLVADGASKELLQTATPPDVKGAPAEPVHPNETAEIRRIRAYRAAIGGKTYQMLRGEFHRHTEISAHRDQDGPVEDVWRYGLDVARMDWIGLGDHDNGVGREYTWWLTQKMSDLYYHAPVFMPLFTYERSVVFPSGHRNVMFAKRGIRPLPRMGQPQQQKELVFGTRDGGSPDIKNLYAYLKFFHGICSSHTSATNMGTDWRDNDPAVEPVVEIYQGYRQNYEEPQAPKSARNAEDSIGGYQPEGYVWNAFGKGYKLGFQVSSDHISTHISYGIVYAERPTREAILDAFKKRHSYGANDNIILDVRSGQQMMGDEFTRSTPPRLNITVVGTAPVARVDIVRQIDRAKPEYVYATEPKQQNVKLSWADPAPKAGAQNMYYVRVQQADGKMAWASPMWIHYQPSK